MKKTLVALATLLAVLIGFTGCPNPSDSSPDNKPAEVTYSDWKIKGSWDGWAEHKLIVDELDANIITYTITDLYKNDSVPLLHEFVLIPAAGGELKYGSDNKITLGTEFEMGGDKNVHFEATHKTHVVTVNISDLKKVKTTVGIGSGALATDETNAILLDKLAIKGNLFSKINDAAVGAWTATKGTVKGNTMSWNVLVDNKNGEFGFDSINGFLCGVQEDISGLTLEASTTTVALKGDEGGNCKLEGMPKNGGVYTIAVTVDVSKSVADGRYSITVTYKTAGTEDWKFEAWDTVVFNGNFDGTNWVEGIAFTKAGDAWTYELEAGTTEVNFKPGKTGWGDSKGFGDIVVGDDSLELSDTGNIGFTAEVGKTYVITISFDADDFESVGKPTVTVKAKP